MDLQSKELYPLLVPHVQGVADSPHVREQIWGQARKLPQEIQDLLLSDEIKLYILSKSQEGELKESDTEHLSRLIRSYFFGSDTLGNITAGIGALFHRDAAFGQGIIDGLHTLQITSDENELAIDPAYESAVAPTELLTLEAGVEKYPQVLKQLVTTDKIITKPFLNPLSPTVKNWIAVYEKISGVKQHSAIERGDFLYRSQACKAITDADRNKLTQLLGARDEGTELLFDIEKGGILWQKKPLASEKNNITATATPLPQTQNIIPEDHKNNSIPAPRGIKKQVAFDNTSTPTSFAGVTGNDGTFSPSITRTKPGEVEENGDPKIVTRQRMPLGAVRGTAQEKSQENTSTLEEASTLPQPPRFVGSARSAISQQTASTQQNSPSHASNASHASLQNFAHVNKKTIDASQEDTPNELSNLVQKDDLQLNFSSGQTLPAEKAKASFEREAPTIPSPTPQPKRSPFHIDPMGRRG